jgi:hypothetical protein
MAQKRKQSTKQNNYEGYNALEAYCIGLHEFYTALRNAGFAYDIAIGIVIEPSAYPDWLLPKPVTFNPNNPDHTPYEDDED